MGINSNNMTMEIISLGRKFISDSFHSRTAVILGKDIP